MGLCLLSPLLSAKDVFESMNQEKKGRKGRKGTLRELQERKGREKANKGRE